MNHAHIEDMSLLMKLIMIVIVRTIGDIVEGEEMLMSSRRRWHIRHKGSPHTLVFVEEW